MIWGQAMFFVNMMPKPQVTKENNDKLDFIKIKNFCASKGTKRESKKDSPRNGRQYFKSYIWLGTYFQNI